MNARTGSLGIIRRAVPGMPFQNRHKTVGEFSKGISVYRQGYLPNGGSWIDQSAKMLDAFEVIEKELQAIEVEREKRRNQFKR